MTKKTTKKAASKKAASKTMVAYTGSADFQEFGSIDFAKAGVEHEGIRFQRGIAQEVPEEVAKVLVDQDETNAMFHDFKFERVTEEEAEQLEQEINEEDADRLDARALVNEAGMPTEGEDATTEGTADPSSPTATGGESGSTGAGSSTGGSTS